LKKNRAWLLKGLLIAFVTLGIGASVVGATTLVPAILSVTADNIYSFNLNGNPISLGPNSSNWKAIDAYNILLKWLEPNYLSFYVTNKGANSLHNPAGFLAQVSLVKPGQWFEETGVNQILSVDSDYWRIGTNMWNGTTPIAWGANNDSSTIWYHSNSGPVSGISGNAEWIWTANNFASGGDDAAYVSLELTPVPEPTTLLLLGAGLIGVITTRKKFLKV